MTDNKPVTQPTQPTTIQDHATMQKQAIVGKAQELVNVTQNIIDSWINNFVMSEKVKSKRTDQVNTLLGFVNQLANEGVPQINTIGNEIQDPEVSNKVLECNNVIMNAARNLLATIQQQENEFQQEIQAALQPTQQKTEVKTQEA
jgi:hypothetical protein